MTDATAKTKCAECGAVVWAHWTQCDRCSLLLIAAEGVLAAVTTPNHRWKALDVLRDAITRYDEQNR